MSQISQITSAAKNLSCAEISDFCKEFEQFMEFYRNLCRFCSKFVWRKSLWRKNDKYEVWLLLMLRLVLRKALAICRNMCALGYNCDFRGWQKGDIGEYMGDQGSGRRGKAKCWRLDRGSLVKKVWLANIWGSGGSVRWTAGRDALARAQKTGGRPGGNTPVSKVSESARKRTRTRIFVLLSEWLRTFKKWLGTKCIKCGTNILSSTEPPQSQSYWLHHFLSLIMLAKTRVGVDLRRPVILVIVNLTQWPSWS